MTLGPGKYDEFCTIVRESTAADGVVIIIFGGKLGTGFSVQADLATTMALPDILENVAKQMRQDMGKG